MIFVPVVGYDEAAKVHRPMIPESESIDPRLIPISMFPGNKMARNPDGLYLGDHSIPPILYVDASTGVDVRPEATSAVHTCKTFDYALSLVELFKPKKVTILLKASQTYSLLSNRIIEDCQLNIGFYGDPLYGTADVLLENSHLHSQFQSNLARPVVISAVAQATNSTNCWRMRCIHLVNSKLSSKGVQWNIPATPSVTGLPTAAYSVYSDFIRCEDSEVSLEGSIVNKLSADSNFGFMGVVSRTKGRLRGYASQFLVENSQLSAAGSNAVALANRAFFLKLLPDFPSGNSKDRYYSLVPTALGPTPSSAMLEIQWTLNQAIVDPVSGGASLLTFPNASANFGMGNYIYGAVRDQQRRLVNVSTNLFI